MAEKDGAGPNNDTSIKKAFKETRDIVEKSTEPTTAKLLREITTRLDSNHSEATKRFCDDMPKAVAKFNKWKMKSVKLITKGSQIGQLLTKALTNEKYTDGEIYDDFTSDSFTNEIEHLQGDMARNKAIDVMKLAQDAARDFASWQQHYENISTAGTITATVGGYGAFLYAVATHGLRSVIAASAGPTAGLAIFAVQIWFRWNQAGRQKEGKLNLTKAAIELSDVTESIERDILFLSELEVYVDNITKCQQKVKNSKMFNQLQKDKVLHSAMKITEACNRYIDD